MSTNFYVIKEDKEYHIGISTWGWSFTFRGYPGEQLISWQAWKEFLRDKIIMNEYREGVDYDNFVKWIETVKSPGYVRGDGHRNLHHNEQGKIEKYYSQEYDWDDEDGYAFTSREFS